MIGIISLILLCLKQLLSVGVAPTTCVVSATRLVVIAAMAASSRGQLVQCLLNLNGNGWRRGQVIAHRLEAVLIGNVGQHDLVSLGTGVGEGSLRGLSLSTLYSGVLQVAHFLGLYAVSGFIFVLELELNN